MVRKRTAEMAVFKDESEAASTPPHTGINNRNYDQNENNNKSENDNSHRLPPPRKKTRVRKGSPVAASAAPRTRRTALKEKAGNPSSSDSSFLRSMGKDESFHGKQRPARKRETLPAIGKAKALELTTIRSPLQDISNASNPLHKALKEGLSTKTFDELILLADKDAAQGAADLITKNDCWSPELLDCFRASNLTSLNLSSPAAPPGELVLRDPFSEIVKKLFQQDKFSSLAVVSFRNTWLNNDDVASLRLLSHLESLDLSGTGIGTQALHHLVCHRHTLKILNLSLNPLVDDDARVALSAFPNLTAVYLRGTSITMAGLRRLVQGVLPHTCRLLSIPEHCISHLNTRHGRYMIDIPDTYVQDPANVDSLTLPALKWNLEFHAKANRDVHVTGTKAELNNRLFAILSNRAADSKIIGRMGRAPVTT